MAGLTLISNRDAVLPGEQSLVKCFDFPGSSRYLLERLEDRCATGKLAKSLAAKSLLQQIRQWVETIEKIGYAPDSWSGNQPSDSSLVKLHQVFAAEASENYIEKFGDTLQFDFAFGDQSEFLRAYTVNGVVMDEKELQGKEGAKLADELFNAWLAMQFSYVSKDGKIYEADPASGRIKQDDQGNPVPAGVEVIKSTMHDSQQGFDAFLQKRGIQLTSQEHPFPSQVQAQQPGAAAETPKPSEKNATAGSQAPSINVGDDQAPTLPGQA